MTIINTSPDRIIQLGYEGEDRVTVLRFRYGANWLENGEGIFHIRVRRHGEHTAYNAQLVADDAENNCLLMTVTNTELSVKGSGEMQVVYSGENFVKKSPIYSYNVSRAVDEVADPPAQDVYTQIIESLSELQTDIRQIDSDVSDLSELTAEKIGDMTELTTEDKISLVSAINEVNSKSVDDVLSATSTNPVQNRVITEHIDGLNSDIDDLGASIEDVQTAIQGKADVQTVSALADAVQNLDGDVQGLQTTVQAKADTSTVTALSGTVSGLQTAVQSKADAQTVTALSGTVTDLQTSKADKTYVDVQLDGKASTQSVSDLVDDVYDIYPTDTASGVIANFPDGANSVPVKSLTVAIEPVQDLHGYDSPWPAGGGKNLLDPSTVSALGNTVWFCEPNGFLFNGGVSYTFSVSNVDDVDSIAIYATDKSTRLAYSTGSTRQSVTYTPTEDTYGLPRLYRVTAITQAIVDGTMIEVGSSRTTYAPYSNICPISGWTGANVTRTGFNAWDEQTELGTINSSGENTPSTTTLRTVNYIPVLPGKTYYYKSIETAGLRFYDANKIFKSSATGTKNATFTVPLGCYYLRFVILSGYGTTYNHDISINYPATDTQYHAGHVSTSTITFPNPPGTVYGGTLDVTTGVLTVDRAMADLGTFTYTRMELPAPVTGRGYVFRASNFNMKTNSTKCVCSEYPYLGSYIPLGTHDKAVGYIYAKNICVRDDDYTDATDFATAMSGVQLVYELETPITYTLTPQEVSTLLGQNNIWADAGDTTVEYRANTSAYIAKKISEAISALS